MTISGLGSYTATAAASYAGVSPSEVHTRLARHMIVDGYDFVLDLHRSQGSWLVDACTGTRYLDMYTFVASAPLGCNPPQIVNDAEFMTVLTNAAVNKPANPDLYSTYLVDFCETFARVLGDPALPHLFFVEGGALAVENALKCAFDWKSRHNEMRGRPQNLGTKVLHLTRAFHGRSGYTLSLTNTDHAKIDRFPQFDWPRIEVPAIRFPLDDHVAEIEAAERRALSQAEAAFAAHPHDIACFVAEPIQGEGGDNHMRPEFLQAMQRLCIDNDALLILDEVQTGVGLTGTAWAYQQMGLAPDVVAFAKKVQLGGIMAGRRVDEIPHNVFAVSGRLSSTWGGAIVDMVRSRRYLEIIEREGYIERAGRVGSWFLGELAALASRHPEMLSNVRGRGLMIAFDLPNRVERDEVLNRLRLEHHILALSCATRSIRLRPALCVTEDELALVLQALDRVLTREPFHH